MQPIERFIRAMLIIALFAFLSALLSRSAQGAELSLGLNYLSGQHDTRSLNLGLNMPLRNDKAIFSSKLRYGKHDDEIVQNQGYVRLGYDPSLTKTWSLWFYEQIGYDKPKDIDFESFIGGGPKYTFYQSDTSKASASFGYLYHYQEDKQVNRLSLRLKGKNKLDLLGLFDLFAVAFYQPNIEDFDDYLADAEVGLSIAILDDLRLKLSIEDHYRSTLKDKNEFLTGLHLVVRF